MRQDQVIAIPPLTPIVKIIIITCVACYFGEKIMAGLGFDIAGIFGLVPYSLIKDKWVWQSFTYMFFHGPPFHILLNMLILWYFGAEIEMRMGQAGFIRYFFICGVGAALFNVAIILLFGGDNSSLSLPWREACIEARNLCTPIIGASGAIYGILAAYGVFFGNRYFLVFFLFPMKAKYFVLLVAAMELLTGMESNPHDDNIAHFAHLGGMVCGAVYIYLKFVRPVQSKNVWQGMKDKEREKLKKKFKLIVNEENKDDEPKPPTYH